MNLRASAGHKLGQLIGNWFEEFFVLPLLRKVSQELGLFLDNRFIERPIRGDKILWEDSDRNEVDYDFVLELNGARDEIGIPVAFVECFWRRGSRHSKDKARDDSGKLMPMRDTYPTARFLGIVAAGDFTGPARQLVRSREIDLFCVPKQKVVEAFEEKGLIIDYPDQAEEGEKQRIAREFEANFSSQIKVSVADSLIKKIGQVAVDSYIDRVGSHLGALPQEIRFVQRQSSNPVVFSSIEDATRFLDHPSFVANAQARSYIYQIVYSDGAEFEQAASSIEALRELHGQIVALANHMSNLE